MEIQDLKDIKIEPVIFNIFLLNSAMKTITIGNGQLFKIENIACAIFFRYSTF